MNGFDFNINWLLLHNFYSLTQVASRAWPARQANSTLKDMNRELDQIRYDIADIERWTKRFVDACHQGFVIDV